MSRGMMNAVMPRWRSARSELAKVTKNAAMSRFEIQALAPLMHEVVAVAP